MGEIRDYIREHKEEARRARLKKLKSSKVMQDMANLILNTPVHSKVLVDEIRARFPLLDEREITNGFIQLLAINDKAMEGNIRAFETMRDTSGQKPIDKVDVTTSEENMVIRIITPEEDIERESSIESSVNEYIESSGISDEELAREVVVKIGDGEEDF